MNCALTAGKTVNTQAVVETKFSSLKCCNENSDHTQLLVCRLRIHNTNNWTSWIFENHKERIDVYSHTQLQT